MKLSTPVLFALGAVSLLGGAGVGMASFGTSPVPLLDGFLAEKDAGDLDTAEPVPARRGAVVDLGQFVIPLTSATGDKNILLAEVQVALPGSDATPDATVMRKVRLRHHVMDAFYDLAAQGSLESARPSELADAIRAILVKQGGDAAGVEEILFGRLLVQDRMM